MRLRSLLLACASLAFVPMTAQASTPVQCGDDAGRARLGVGTYEYTFDAPVVTAPELAATHDATQDPDVTGNLVSNHRTATFFFVGDFAPSEFGMVDARLEWETQSDFDLYLVDEFGDPRGASAASNIDDGQTTFEQFSDALVFNCEHVILRVRSWAAVSQPLHLQLTVRAGETLLACAENDFAAGCAGKAAGEAPDAAPADTRRHLYFAGDPGLVAMPGPYVQSLTDEEMPFSSAVSEERPTGGVPNSHTRGALGFRGAPPPDGATFQSPFSPHFSLPLDDLYDETGDVGAMIWASSPVADRSTKVWADLFVDGAHIAETFVAGDATKKMRDPVPLFFTFSDVHLIGTESITIQFATNPVATSRGDVGNPADGGLTFWYGSVQYQSGMTLPA